jgi:hypothetical protein
VPASVAALGAALLVFEVLRASLARRTVRKVLEPGMELLLFRLGDRGYASPRKRVREVVDVGAGQPAVPGLSASSLGGLGGGQRPVALVSLRVALGSTGTPSACPPGSPPPARRSSVAWGERRPEECRAQRTDQP